MTRYLTESEGIWVPQPWRTDASVARTYLATSGDPARGGTGLLVADGDTWLNCPRDTSPIPPPPPPPPPPPGTEKPGPSNTGPLARGITPVPYPLTGGVGGDIVSGVLTLLDSGIDLKGYDIPARVVYKNAGQKLRGCKIRGGAAVTSGGDVGLVDCSAAAVRDALIEDCELVPDNPSAWVNGIRGHDFTEQRNNIHGVVDGIDYFPAVAGGVLNAFSLASWVHDLGGWGPDSIGRVWVHADCRQCPGGTGLTIIGCADYGFFDPTIGQASNPAVNPNYPQMNTNSVMQVTQNSGNMRGLMWTDSWVYGGGASLNFDAKGGTAGLVGTLARIKFGHDQFFQGGPASGDGVYGSGGDNSVAFKSVGGLSFNLSDLVYEDNGHQINTSPSRIS